MGALALPLQMPESRPGGKPMTICDCALFVLHAFFVVKSPPPRASFPLPYQRPSAQISG
jgi:hypothetical protein